MTDEQRANNTKRQPIPIRMKFLVGLLLFIAFTFAVNAAHIYALEEELREIAAGKEAIERTRSERIGRPIETASIVTASKANIVYGDVHGKIEVYLKHAGQGGQLIGIDYFMVREDGEWSQTESGMCTDEECQVRGALAFAEK